MSTCFMEEQNDNTVMNEENFFIPSGVDLTRIFFVDMPHLFQSLETMWTGS